MLQRGTLHAIDGTDARAVVITRDAWNARMSSVGMVPLASTAATHGFLAPLGEGSGLAFDVTGLVTVPRGRIGEALAVIDDGVLHGIERAASALLDAERILADPPRASRLPAGPIDYPRCGEIRYLVGERIDGEAKRYLVVSNDRWNQRRRTVLVVRTTAQTKRPFEEFPLIHDGAAQVVCGELTAIPAAAVELRRRPPGMNRVGLLEFAAVLRGCSFTHMLRDHLDPFEVEIANGLE
jgi:mRNA-degrading endonuclease toxin of MazEF toxin-antitoxin module